MDSAVVLCFVVIILTATGMVIVSIQRTGSTNILNELRQARDVTTFQIARPPFIQGLSVQHRIRRFRKPEAEGRQIYNSTPVLQTLAENLHKILTKNDSSFIRSASSSIQSYITCEQMPFCRRQLLKGAMFTIARRKYQIVFHSIRAQMIHNFSDVTETKFRRMLSDKGNMTSYLATGAAILVSSDGKRIKLVQRIWDSSAERRFLSDEETLNTWPENYLFHQDLDISYNPTSKGSILGIPTTSNCKFSNINLYRTDGPMDPRLIRLNRTHEFLVFHLWRFTEDQDAENRKIVGHMFLWSFYDNSLVELDVHGFRLMTTEINWSPFVKDGKLHFIYSFDPLRVLRCSVYGRQAGKCHFVYVQQEAFDHEFKRKEDHLRGGTPLALYKWPYYITVAHSQLMDSETEDLTYRAHLCVLKVEPFKIVYLSQGIKLSDDVFDRVPIVRDHVIADDFFFPMGLRLLNDDEVDVSGHINDYSGHVIRLTGLRHVMDDVIRTDKNQPRYTGSASRMIQKALKHLLS